MDNLWINKRKINALWKTWITEAGVLSCPQGFPNMIFPVVSGKSEVFHNFTASTTTTTDQIFYILLTHVNKGVVHNYEINMQQGFTVTVYQYCK